MDLRLVLDIELYLNELLEWTFIISLKIIVSLIVRIRQVTECENLLCLISTRISRIVNLNDIG